MNELLSVLGLLMTVGGPTVLVVASYRRAKPYKEVGHCLDTGMVKVRWRDDPKRTYIYTPDRLSDILQGRALR
ncbi:hypothetical protein FXF51_02270 [Nonomuraea sp. PA05]|uniref:hypothetical protein n=1 Tax=Nonomuraea sp. PA05 TaxID=2604466 RepID=UPI0011DBEC6F|nr:hypothetical protein [Nonomuraea sp. PA05]TYB71279.1 hypothetical protein FXF51_02270 [Nonomuraea sp. PA05]